MRPDLAPGNRFPDFCFPDITGTELGLSDVAKGRPLLLCFVRGWWCPKEQVRLRMLVAMEDEIQREYARMCVVTVDPPYVNGALRAGLGANFPFLSDERRELGERYDLLELTDRRHNPYLPLTFLLDSALRIRWSWCGFWFRGNPTPEEIRQGLREIARDEQPSFDPWSVWENGGSAPASAGIEGDAIYVREDEEGREIVRGVWRREVPEVGAEVGRSDTDGRMWRVVGVDRDIDRVAVRMRKDGSPSTDPLPMHHISAPSLMKIV